MKMVKSLFKFIVMGVVGFMFSTYAYAAPKPQAFDFAKCDKAWSALYEKKNVKGFYIEHNACINLERFLKGYQEVIKMDESLKDYALGKTKNGYNIYDDIKDPNNEYRTLDMTDVLSKEEHDEFDNALRPYCKIITRTIQAYDELGLAVNPYQDYGFKPDAKDYYVQVTQQVKEYQSYMYNLLGTQITHCVKELRASNSIEKKSYILR